ncbi:uncharacterized protein LOC144576820 [Callithrix jacchus]
MTPGFPGGSGGLGGGGAGRKPSAAGGRDGGGPPNELAPTAGAERCASGGRLMGKDGGQRVGARRPQSVIGGCPSATALRENDRPTHLVHLQKSTVSRATRHGGKKKEAPKEPPLRLRPHLGAAGVGAPGGAPDRLRFP